VVGNTAGSAGGKTVAALRSCIAPIIFDEALIARLAQCYVRVLAIVAEEPATTIEQLMEKAPAPLRLAPSFQTPLPLAREGDVAGIYDESPVMQAVESCSADRTPEPIVAGQDSRTVDFSASSNRRFCASGPP
jgi:hypothetical protein